jgi:hypothetical protein
METGISSITSFLAASAISLAFIVATAADPRMSPKYGRAACVLANWVEEVQPDRLREHMEKNSPGDEWAELDIRNAISAHPGGTLFFFNTPERQWRNLGGMRGYAIHKNGRVVWYRQLRIS